MPTPTEIKFLQKDRTVTITFDDGHAFTLSCEYLRAFSPSAEVQGHGGGVPRFITGKQTVNITRIEPVGQYAVKLIFDDGHDTGLYTWDWLYDLGQHQQAYWERYQAHNKDFSTER